MLDASSTHIIHQFNWHKSNCVKSVWFFEEKFCFNKHNFFFFKYGENSLRKHYTLNNSYKSMKIVWKSKSRWWYVFVLFLLQSAYTFVFSIDNFIINMHAVRHKNHFTFVYCAGLVTTKLLMHTWNTLTIIKCSACVRFFNRTKTTYTKFIKRFFFFKFLLSFEHSEACVMSFMYL